jgi:hypothetical protein
MAKAKQSPGKNGFIYCNNTHNNFMRLPRLAHPHGWSMARKDDESYQANPLLRVTLFML